MMDTKSAIPSIAIVAFLALSACQTQQPATSTASGPFEGNWASADGIYTARMRANRFIATASDTGGTISEGTYTTTSQTSVDLQWYGIVSGRPGSAKCALAGSTTLNCVDGNGNDFVLNKVA